MDDKITSNSAVLSNTYCLKYFPVLNFPLCIMVLSYSMAFVLQIWLSSLISSSWQIYCFPYVPLYIYWDYDYPQVSVAPAMKDGQNFWLEIGLLPLNSYIALALFYNISHLKYREVVMK